MNKEIFLTELRAKLVGLPQDEIEERISFYNEMINDRIEDGLTEEEAAAAIGSVDSVAEQIISETPLSILVKEKVRPKRKLQALEIVLIILGAPLWIPLVLAALAVVLALYVVIWSAVICVYAADFSFAVGALASIAAITAFIRAVNFAGVLFSAGTGAACAGLTILLFFVCVSLTKGLIKATGRMLLGIKISFTGREE